jgi:hypothetical protein
MPRLGPPPHDLVGAGHPGTAWFGRGAGVEMILQRLPPHVAAVAGDELLHDVFRAGRHLRVTQAGDQRFEQGTGSGVSIGAAHTAAVVFHRVFLTVAGLALTTQTAQEDPLSSVCHTGRVTPARDQNHPRG